MTQVTATGNGYILYVDVWESSYNASNNTSVLSYQMALRADTSPSGFSGYSPDTSNTYIVINGVGTFYCTSGQRTVNRGSTVTFFSGSVTVSHDSNSGAGSWTFYGRLLMQNPYPSISYMPPDMTTGTGTANATTFTGPSQPAAPTLTRSSDGGTIGITSATPSSSGTQSITAYQYMWSYDNTNWSAANAMSGTSGTLSATTTQPYYVATRAISNSSYGWGYSAWSPSTLINAVPTNPSSISVAVSGRTATVTVGASSSNGGATASYWVRYSANGGAYSTAIAATGSPLTATFTNLPPSVTYTFQAYATNSIGYSTNTTSSSVYILAGGKRYDSATSSWVPVSILRRWDGGAWVDITVAKRWNGSAWVDLT